MLIATLKCSNCGAVFSVDLDKDDDKCPKCGGDSNPTTSKSDSKSIIGGT